MALQWHPYDQRPTDFLNDKSAANLHVFNTTQLCFEEVDKVNTARVSLVLKEATAQNAWVAIFRSIEITTWRFRFLKNYLDAMVFCKFRWLQRLPVIVDDHQYELEKLVYRGVFGIVGRSWPVCENMPVQPSPAPIWQTLFTPELVPMYTMSCRSSQVCIYPLSSSGCCSARSSQHLSSSRSPQHPSIFSLQTTKRGVYFAWNKTQTNITFFLASLLREVPPHMPYSVLLRASVSVFLLSRRFLEA